MIRVVDSFALLTFCCSLGAIAGCGGGDTVEGPATVPVSGKVAFTKGGPVSVLAEWSGRVQFDSLDQPGVRAAGAILEDGSFRIGTNTDTGPKPGAVPGKHRVRLVLDDDARGVVAPKFLDFAKSGIVVTVPSDQPLEIQVSK